MDAVAATTFLQWLLPQPPAQHSSIPQRHKIAQATAAALMAGIQIDVAALCYHGLNVFEVEEDSMQIACPNGHLNDPCGAQTLSVLSFG